MVTQTQRTMTRSGYKQTEIGIIPEDWKSEIIFKNVDVMMGQSPLGETYNQSKGIPLLNGPTEFGLVNPFPIQYTTKPTKLSKSGDILLCVRGSTTGRLNISDQTYCIGRGLASIRGKSGKTDTKWLFYHFVKLQNYIFRIASGGGSTFPNINQDFINRILLPFPPLPEQQKIAQVISDADNLIQQLDDLITKRKNIKQGTMQELLTGKRRLEGFRGKWKETPLEKIGTFAKGRGIKKTDIVDSGLPCIRYGEIYTKYNVYVKDSLSHISVDVARQSQQIKNGDILFAGSGETAEEIGKCVVYLGEENCYAGGDMIIFSPLGNEPLFLAFLLNSDYVNKQKSRMAQGDMIVHIYSSAIKKIKISIPEFQEQLAIAKILSDMDKELRQLETKRDKYIMIKNGMMQKLLTGEIRLK